VLAASFREKDMRVWLVDEKNTGSSGLEASLRQLEERIGAEVRLLGASVFQPDLAAAMRKLVPDLLDVLILNEQVCPDGSWIQDVLSLGVGVLVVTTVERLERFRAMAATRPVHFLLSGSGVDSLWLALVATAAAQQRDAGWKKEIAHLQQRLNDRIIIERAKGILVQRLHITEEDAYKRLRLLSRRQRRQIRDIAQSLLDTEFLFSPETNGIFWQSEETRKPPEKTLPAS
jgi:AmiR/NasT family two-component response regulator